MNNDKATSVFATLNAIDVNQLKEQKGRFDYLSWSDAVAELLKIYPTASWQVHEIDSMPYIKTELGYFVKVTVTVDSIPRTCIHPVLDNLNRPIVKPNCFQINASIQRALAKAIALHGLGLYIYRGEDLPPGEGDTITNTTPTTPRPGKSPAQLTHERQIMTLKTAKTMTELQQKFIEFYSNAKLAKNEKAMDELLITKDICKAELELEGK